MNHIVKIVFTAIWWKIETLTANHNPSQFTRHHIQIWRPAWYLYQDALKKKAVWAAVGLTLSESVVNSLLLLLTEIKHSYSILLNLRHTAKWSCDRWSSVLLDDLQDTIKLILIHRDVWVIFVDKSHNRGLGSPNSSCEPLVFFWFLCAMYSSNRSSASIFLSCPHSWSGWP